MEALNKLRLLAGITIKSQSTVLHEARTVPLAKHELAPKDAKTLNTCARNLEIAARHVEQAISGLEKIPATDFMGDVPHMINQLEQCLGKESDKYGLKHLAKTYRAEHGKATEEEEEQTRDEDEVMVRSRSHDHQECEDMECNIHSDAGLGIDDHAEYKEEGEEVPVKRKPKKISGIDTESENFLRRKIKELKAEIKKDKPDNLESANNLESAKNDLQAYNELLIQLRSSAANSMKESTLNYAPGNEVSWAASDQPVNIVPTTELPTAYPTAPGADESPEQMVNNANLDSDYSRKVPVPNALKTSLKTSIGALRSEFEKYKGRDDVAATHYNTSAEALEAIHGHLATGTTGSLKQAGIFMTKLMSPILHKIPTDVVDFISRGGQHRSLKQHFFALKK
ncbi:MAG: hypothetical protein ACREAU_00070 [Nitrosopumilaceae archaeon]